MSLADYRHRANELRFRLRNPPNAVPDREVRMSRGSPVEVLRPFAKSPPIPEIEFHRRCLEFFNACVAQKPERPKGKKFITQSIIEMVANYYLITPHELLSDRRTKNVVIPRWIIMWLMRELTMQSLPWIGQRLNRRDHSTVLHGLRQIETMRKSDPELQDELNQFLVALRSIKENGNATTPPRT